MPTATEYRAAAGRFRALAEQIHREAGAQVSWAHPSYLGPGPVGEVLDGDQHLGSANAYRSDRRKDALLQEHRYFVLRFLAADLAKNLCQIIAGKPNHAVLCFMIANRPAVRPGANKDLKLQCAKARSVSAIATSLALANRHPSRHP